MVDMAEPAGAAVVEEEGAVAGTAGRSFLPCGDEVERLLEGEKLKLLFLQYVVM